MGRLEKIIRRLKGQSTPQSRVREGDPVAIDPDQVDERTGRPGFLARPLGATAYYGFPILDDVEADGCKLGMISDWEAAPGMREGDAFVVAPDDSRCGINWYVSHEPLFRQVMPPDRRRWGVWDVGFPHEMSSRQSATKNLAHHIADLKQVWEAWRREFGP